MRLKKTSSHTRSKLSTIKVKQSARQTQRKRKLGKEEERHSWFLFLIISYFVGSGTQGISLRAVQARHEKCGLTYKAKSRTTKLGKSATIAHL